MRPTKTPILFTLFVLLCALHCVTRATTIVAARTSREIVLGADSKVTDTFGNALERQACKIVQAGNLFFAYEGMARDRETGFDIGQLAARALELKPDASASEKVDILTGFVVSRLFVELPFLKQHDPNTYHAKIEGRTFLKIIVAGFEDGKPLLFVRHFRAFPLSRQVIGASVVPDDCLSDCTGEVVTKFLGETDAIEGLAEETPDFWKRGLAEGVRQLVETEIAARPEYVGAPVDLLRIDATGARWIQRKPTCADMPMRPPSPVKSPPDKLSPGKASPGKPSDKPSDNSTPGKSSPDSSTPTRARPMRS